MNNFQFVTLTNPADVKEKRHQFLIRGHAIRTSAKKTRKEAVRKKENFVVVGIDPNDGGPVKRRAKEKKVAVSRAPSIGRLDPFNSLPANPERLRMLMRHKRAKQAGEPVFCIEDAGKIYFQGMDTIFQGALTDPALFHALSLVLSLAANNDIPNVECLTHRGELLSNLQKTMADPDRLSQVSTLTAMLMLIGFEYRVDGVASSSISIHIRAADELLRVGQKRDSVLMGAIRRALFWQDLYSAIMVGTPRVLSHEHFPELCWARDPDRSSSYKVPEGFGHIVDKLPRDFAIVLEDLNALCRLIDEQCQHNDSAIFEIGVDDGQAWIESRLVNLLLEWRRRQQNNSMYEACILGAFLCTYKLSTVIWEGCYIPEWLASNIMRILLGTSNGWEWKQMPELLLWLLLIAGSLTTRSTTRLQASMLIQRTYQITLADMHQTWPTVLETLKRFVWSEHVMQEHFLRFWEELHPEACKGKDESILQEYLTQ